MLAAVIHVRGGDVLELAVVDTSRSDAGVLVGDDLDVLHRLALDIPAGLCQLRDHVAASVVVKDFSKTHRETEYVVQACSARGGTCPKERW